MDPFTTITNPRALACACANAALTSADDDRPVIACASLAANADELVVTTTDSYIALVQRLAVGREPRMDRENGNDEWTALVAAGDLPLILAALRGVKDSSVDIVRTEVGLLVVVDDREVQVPAQQYEYPNVAQYFDGNTEAVRGLKITSSIVKRVASLQLPNVRADALVVDWRFGGPHEAIAFTPEVEDVDLTWRGVFMPAETIPIDVDSF